MKKMGAIKFTFLVDSGSAKQSQFRAFRPENADGAEQQDQGATPACGDEALGHDAANRVTARSGFEEEVEESAFLVGVAG